jgi:uncharacterized protein (TIGR02996 family)
MEREGRAMNMEEALLAAIHEAPSDEAPWQVLADWLDDQGDPRAELVRLTFTLRTGRAGAERPALEERMQALLASGVAPCVPILTNSIGMKLALIPPGTFLMGSSETEVGRRNDEGPLHPVRITRPFYLGVFPVTQQQYKRIVGRNPSSFAARGRNRSNVVGLDTRSFPVERVSWDDAVAFCAALSARPAERKAGRVYRLPTEAEREYACRAGTSTPFNVGTALSSSQANFEGASPYGGARRGPYLQRTVPVGSYAPNAFGLHDMHGNVWDWCADWYDAAYYSSSPSSDPEGPSSGLGRVLRGGSWGKFGKNCRSACRDSARADFRESFVGIRVAMSVVKR